MKASRPESSFGGIISVYTDIHLSGDYKKGYFYYHYVKRLKERVIRE